MVEEQTADITRGRGPGTQVKGKTNKSPQGDLRLLLGPGPYINF